MKKINAVIAAAAICLSMDAIAQEAPAFYLGASLGNTQFKIPDLDYSVDKFSWGAFVGYQFNPFVGVELGYLRANKVSETDGTASAEVQGSAVTGSVIGTYPISEHWSVHGRMGGARSTIRAIATDGTTVISGTDSATDLIYGIGVGLMADGAKLRLEYQRIDGSTIKVRLVSLGIVWHLPNSR